MKNIALAVAAGAAIVLAGPLFVGTVAAKAEQLKMAQGVDVQIGRDRQDNGRRDQQDNGHRDQRDENPGFSVGVGPNGVVVGPKQRCHTVTTIVERPDGRRVKTTERRCD
jgi:hypothetical protein